MRRVSNRVCVGVRLRRRFLCTTAQSSHETDVSRQLEDASTDDLVRDPWIKSELDELVEPPPPPPPPQVSTASRRSVILFPGQGSQFVGMGKELYHYPNVKDIYGSASEILGYDLFKMCRNGPVEWLNRTEYCQPAVFVTALAALEKLKAVHPTAVEDCVGTAGFSVGEFAALVFSGALQFETAVELVKRRGEYMQDACQLEKSVMLTVKTRASSQLGVAMQEAKLWMRNRGCERPVCEVANYLYTKCVVVGGHEEAIKFIENNADEFELIGTRRLPVSGAFHTPLMRPAANKFSQVLDSVMLRRTRVDVFSNVDGEPHTDDAVSVKRRLVKQMCAPVRWEQTLHHICDMAKEEGDNVFVRTYEVGPGKQLSTMLAHTNKRAARQCTVIAV